MLFASLDDIAATCLDDLFRGTPSGWSMRVCRACPHLNAQPLRSGHVLKVLFARGEPVLAPAIGEYRAPQPAHFLGLGAAGLTGRDGAQQHGTEGDSEDTVGTGGAVSSSHQSRGCRWATVLCSP